MKIKKLTALMAAGILAVCAVPVSAGADILKGDINQDGVVDSTDGDLMLDFIATYHDSVNYATLSENEIQHYTTYGDINGNGYVDYNDVILLGEINSNITVNTQMGDVNHDGYVDAVDATAVLQYYAALSTENYDEYKEAEHENFQTYGNVTKDKLGDNDVNSLDASWILAQYAENSTPLSE